MLDLLEVLAAEPIQHAAPELRVAADAVVRVGAELAAALVNPVFVDAVAKMLPHGLRIPVLCFLRDEVAALDDEDARAGARERMRNSATASTAPDDDDVEA